MPYKEVLAEVSEKCLSGGPQIWKSLNGGTLARKADMYMSMADPGVTLVLDCSSLYTVICWQCTTSQVGTVPFLQCGLPSKGFALPVVGWERLHTEFHTQLYSSTPSILFELQRYSGCVCRQEDKRSLCLLPVWSYSSTLGETSSKYISFSVPQPHTVETHFQVSSYSKLRILWAS